MIRPTAPAPVSVPGASDTFCRLPVFIGVAALGLITLVFPGATRMQSWPWSIAYLVAIIIPGLVLLIRLGTRRERFILPSPAWFVLTLAAGGGLLASSLLSPFRGSALLASAPLLAALALFLAAFDWLHAVPEAISAKRAQLLTGTGSFLAAVALTSAGLWARGLSEFPSAAQVFAARNPYPLGHSNYTAGLALLMLPCFSALIARDRGRQRLPWVAALLLALVMLATSGSRGGLIGLAMLAVVFAPRLAQALRVRLWIVATAGLVLVTGLLVLNPRTRAMIRPEPVSIEPNISNVQRTAMVTAGLAMGRDQPLLGWGPGSTPFVYPHYRARLEGGAENVLQLHSTPVQFWAESGIIGLASLAALLLLGLDSLVRGSSTVSRIVLLGLTGYGVFSFTDWQFDVPVFGGLLALAAALIAPPGLTFRAGPRVALGVLALLAFGLVAGLGRRDPAPALNVQALELAPNPAHADEAVALLKQSLALNPNQEIAHFNLGWLLLVRDPVAAERHFLAAARLVPDKGGVYFGLGLALLNQGRPDTAAQLFALECLNDPLFLTSPWWRTTPLRELRQAHAADFIRLSQDAARRLALRGGWQAREAAYNAALSEWLLGHPAPGEMLARSLTSERVNYFARRPRAPDFTDGPVRTYRRERTGYPVLMRNLDLPVPRDLYDVQETPLATDELAFLFPRKGWLRSPLLLELLDERMAGSKSTQPLP